MANLRLIARMDIKAPNLIKGVRMEGLRVLGDPREYATRYYLGGADEILYMDIVASLYGRNHLEELVKYTAEHTFIPITVGGGVRSVEDASRLLRAGADKIAVNTAAVKRPELITGIARRFGSQCAVLSVEAKQKPGRGWEVYTDNGREHTGRDVLDWVREAAERGAGEILLTSVDQEGTRKGFDLELIRQVSEAVPLPVVASGGMGKMEHFLEVVRCADLSGVAFAGVMHYNVMTFSQLREAAVRSEIPVRSV